MTRDPGKATMAQLTLEQAFRIAVQHHQAGRLPEAEQLYRRILEVRPNHADALHLLGLAAHQAGKNDIAVNLIRRALAVRPDWPEAYANLGVALQAKGQIDEAIVAFRQIIALRPNYAEARNNLGIALKDTGQLDDAIACFRQAIALKLSYSEAYVNLGGALYETGQLDEAIAALRQAISLKPDYPEAYSNLGVTLKDKGQLDEAIAAFRQAIALRPNYPEAYSNLSVALQEKGQPDEAVAACQRAIALKSNYAEGHSNLGSALRNKGQLDEAIAAYQQALALEPNFAEAHSNLGVVLQEKGQLDEAVTAYWRAITLKPDYAEAHRNLSVALLLMGDFAEGWNEYEWRWQCKQFWSPRRNFSQPRWDGTPSPKMTILLHVEQGIGDAIQFIRYVPWVARRCGRVVVLCQSALRRLFQALPDIAQVIQEDDPLPPFDAHCPLLSLPLVLGTTLASIPGDVPYLTADRSLTEQWRERLDGAAPGLKVGLLWAGNPAHKNDRNRSMSLRDLAALTEARSVQFYSLQKGDAARQAKNPPPGMHLTDWTDELNDFADTAALVANLDLVISVDTAVVHLAGAMGKPVWTLLPFAPDWRWLLDRQDSPWYPTMRLFRQPRIGDWESVMRQVMQALMANER